jgi:hypothetical protein
VRADEPHDSVFPSSHSFVLHFSTLGCGVETSVEEQALQRRRGGRRRRRRRAEGLQGYRKKEMLRE